MKLKDLKELLSIYMYSSDGRTRDYTWDEAEISLWDPSAQREMNLVFTGSSRDDDPAKSKICFNVSYKKQQNSPIYAFMEAIKAMDLSGEQENKMFRIFIDKLKESPK